MGGWGSAVVPFVDKVGENRYIRKKNANDFTAILKRANNYDVWSEQDDRQIVIYACRTGRVTRSKRGLIQDPIAQVISSKNPGVLIVAPEGRTKTNGDEFLGIVEKTNTDPDGWYDDGYNTHNTKVDNNKETYWNAFKDGELVAQYDNEWMPHYNGQDKEEYDNAHRVYDINDSSTKPKGSYARYYPENDDIETDSNNSEGFQNTDGRKFKWAVMINIGQNGDTTYTQNGDTIQIESTTNNGN